MAYLDWTTKLSQHLHISGELRIDRW